MQYLKNNFSFKLLLSIISVLSCYTFALPSNEGEIETLASHQLDEFEKSTSSGYQKSKLPINNFKEHAYIVTSSNSDIHYIANITYLSLDYKQFKNKISIDFSNYISVYEYQMYYSILSSNQFEHHLSSTVVDNSVYLLLNINNNVHYNYKSLNILLKSNDGINWSRINDIPAVDEFHNIYNVDNKLYFSYKDDHQGNGYLFRDNNKWQSINTSFYISNFESFTPTKTSLFIQDYDTDYGFSDVFYSTSDNLEISKTSSLHSTIVNYQGLSLNLDFVKLNSIYSFASKQIAIAEYRTTNKNTDRKNFNMLWQSNNNGKSWQMLSKSYLEFEILDAKFDDNNLLHVLIYTQPDYGDDTCELGSVLYYRINEFELENLADAKPLATMHGYYNGEIIKISETSSDFYLTKRTHNLSSIDFFRLN